MNTERSGRVLAAWAVALAAVVSIGPSHPASAATIEGPTLVADLNDLPQPGVTDGVTLIDGEWWFSGDDGVHGSEVWVSDGTEAGTRMVADLNPTAGSSPHSFTSFDGDVYFVADDGATGQELWRTDGTTTEQVADLRPGTGGGVSPADVLFEFDGHLYFQGDDGDGDGDELYRSDGTTTELFADIVSGSGNSDPTEFTSVDYSGGVPTMFFRAGRSNVLNGIEMWALESGAAAPVEIDIRPGPLNSSPFQVTTVGEFVYAIGSLASPNFSDVYRIEPHATTPSTWTATGLGAARVQSIVALPPGHPHGVLAMSSGVVGDVFNAELYVVPDHVSGPALVRDIRVGSTTSSIQHLTSIGNRLFFSANDGTNGSELWTSDGEPGNPSGETRMIKDIATDALSSAPKNFAPAMAAGTPVIVFSASDDAGDIEPWATTGTEVGTARLVDLATTRSSSPTDFAAVGDDLFLVARTDDFDRELVEIDLSGGTANPPFDVVADVNPTTDGSFPSDFSTFGDLIVFAAGRPTQDEIISYDPSTGAVATLFEAPGDFPGDLAEAGGLLYFNYEADGGDGNELWASDGTQVGTDQVIDLEPGSSGSFPRDLTAFGNLLAFTAETSAVGDELWITDGTEAGTALLVDADPTGDGRPDELTASGDTLFFTADDGSDEWLWASDGTPSGTAVVASGTDAPDNPSGLMAYDDGVVFVSGDEVWFSDGTSNGTVVLDTDDGGDVAQNPNTLTIAGDQVFFFATVDGGGIKAQSASSDDSLWATDRSADGARQLLAPVAGERGDYEIVAIDDERVVASMETQGGLELVISDGTVAGTTELPEVVTGPADADPWLLGAANGVVFFTAETPSTGLEVWYTDGEVVALAGEGKPGSPSSRDDSEALEAGPDFLVAGDALYIPLDTASSIEEPHVFTATPDAPAAPTGVSAALAGDTSADVTWTASPDVAGAPVTGYEVTATPGGATCSTAGPTSCTVTGLDLSTTYTFRVVATNRSGDSAPSAPSNGVTTPTPISAELDAAASFVPLAPSRLFDTRPAEPAPGPKGKVSAGGTIDVQIAGVGGIPDDAVAVVMNVTVADTEAPGFVTAFPTGSPQPLASAININVAGQVRPNLVTVLIGDGGQVSLFSLGAANLLGDVAGYYVDTDVAVAGGRFVPVTPQRLFDTRAGEPAPGPKGLVPSGATIEVQASGVGDIPDDGVAAIVINLTATETQAAGFVTGYPTGDSLPLASNVNFVAAGATSPNLAIIPLGDGGKLSFFVIGGTHLLGDVTGYITDSSAPHSIDGLFVPLEPTRVFDTREEESPPGPKGFVPADESIDVQVAGAAGIPDDAAGVVLNVTGVTSPLGFLTVWERGPSRPMASTLNFAAPVDVRANAAMLPIGVAGQLSFYTLNGSDILADTAGYFLG